MRINTDGSGFTTVGPVFAEALAYDAGADVLYGGINGDFFEVDQMSGAHTALASPPGGADVEGLAFGNRVVYGLARFDSMLYAYEPGSGTWSTIGDTGVEWDLAGLGYDPFNNVLFAKGAQDTMLYAIDPATAASTVVGDTGIAAGGGLAFVVPAPGSLALLGIGGLAAARRGR